MNIEKIRKDFPILGLQNNGQRIVYLDNAATTQKPNSVIDAEAQYYKTCNANIHRGLNFLSQKATEKYEQAHETVARFINAKSAEEIVFTKNTTESLNLLAFSLGGSLKRGDEILLSKMEHHANLVPWQQAALRSGAKLKFADITKDGKLDISDLENKISQKTKIVSVAEASNILGTINPVEKIGKIAKSSGAVFIVDAAQSAPHTKTDVRKINADYIAFSAHKMLGPTGVGVLYGRAELFENLPPFMTGGDMVSNVTLKKSQWNKLPWKFEAGTPNIAGGIAFTNAIEYIEKIGIENIESHEQKLLRVAKKRIGEMENISIYGPKNGPQTGILPFNIKGVHPHDIASILDLRAIAIRAGNHCAQPLMAEMGIEGVARASFYIYNTEQEIATLAGGIEEAKKTFGIK